MENKELNKLKKQTRHHHHGRNRSPAGVIILSFLLLIAVGSVLLNTGFATASGIRPGILDAIFTAASASCVIGFEVVSTFSYWSWFGKLIIFILMQIGGLGFMTIVAGTMVFVRRRLSLKDRMVIQASFNQYNIGGMGHFVKSVVQMTILFEAIGAVILTGIFYFGESMSFSTSLKYGIFHSVSAFCNAGFVLLGDNNLMNYAGNWGMNITIMLLVIAGGIGYTVWLDIYKVVKKGIKEKRPLWYQFVRLTLHSKIVITFTLILILSGTVLFLALEWNNPKTIGEFAGGKKLLASLFHSVNLRTGGFYTVNQAGLNEASTFVSIIYMCIGGSPTGTAGGIKTVTFAIILLSMFSVVKGRNKVEAFNRNISLDQLQKALTVTFMLLAALVISVLVLTFSEAGTAVEYSFLDLLYECSSAVSTAGMTTGITPFLSPIGKIVIIAGMFIGRIGPVTLAVALSMKMIQTSGGISYPDEKLIIG